MGIERVRVAWDDVLSIVSKRSKKAAALLNEAVPRRIDGDTLVVIFGHTHHAVMLNNAPDVLAEALTELIGGHWKVRAEVDGVAVPAPPTFTPESDDWPPPARPASQDVAATPMTMPSTIEPPSTVLFEPLERVATRVTRGRTPIPRTFISYDGPRCAVYLHYDADEVLLYVGMSTAPSLRTGRHAEKSSWVDFAIKGVIIWCDSIAEAEHKEAELIKSLRPLFNIAHATQGTEHRLIAYLAAKERFDLLRSNVSKG